MQKSLIRKEIYPVEEILPQIPTIGYILIGDDYISAGSLRYKTFKKSLVCVTCGLKGTYFAKERFKETERYHLNLYATDKKGKEVLMTKDHIIPLSKGGSHDLDNLQTMCFNCNGKKGNGDKRQEKKKDEKTTNIEGPC
jgi:5-methylcytosine-specific restriction endonuclease McrA